MCLYKGSFHHRNYYLAYNFLKLVLTIVNNKLYCSTLYVSTRGVISAKIKSCS